MDTKKSYTAKIKMHYERKSKTLNNDREEPFDVWESLYKIMTLCPITISHITELRSTAPIMEKIHLIDVITEYP